MGFHLCSPAAHTETLIRNKLYQKEKSSLRIVRGVASCRDLFKPFPTPLTPHPSKDPPQAQVLRAGAAGAAVSRGNGRRSPDPASPAASSRAWGFCSGLTGPGQEQNSAWRRLCIHPSPHRSVRPSVCLSLPSAGERGVSGVFGAETERRQGPAAGLGEPRGGCEPAAAALRRVLAPSRSPRDDETRPAAVGDAAMPRHPHTKACSDEADTCGTHEL